MLRHLSVTITATATFLLLCSSLTLAESKKPKLPDKFPPNPLEITTPDPLLPQLPAQQLNPAELQKLAGALDELNQQANAQLLAGDKEAAFEIWNRELRLRRYFGSLAEVQALSRVGAIAWSNNDRYEVQYITGRLQTIQKKVQLITTDLQLLQALGQAYQQVRAPQPALEVYDQILAKVKFSGDAAAVVETLQKIAEVHLSWFDYPAAAATYEKLLKIAESKGDSQNEITYLQQLAYIYEQAKQPQQSLNTRNKLAEIYVKQNNLTQLPTLKLAIGSDYEALAKNNPNLLKNAFDNYQQAYTTAWQLEQYVRAGEALQKLIALYRSQGQIDEALQTSQILVETQERARNFYGLMNAYDQIAQIHLQRKDYPQAQAAFQKGLELAQQLKYNEEYFAQQLKQISNIGVNIPK